MAYDDTATGTANEELALRLAKDRDSWKEKISNLVSLLKNMSNLSECQVTMLSYRQILLDKITDYYQECMKTCDNLAFAIRNRIRLDDEQQ